MTNVGHLALRAKLLAPSDSLGRAAEAVRASTVGAAPVARDGRLIGIVTAGILAEALGSNPDGAWPDLRVGDLPLDPAIALPAEFTPREALLFFQANGLERAPVLSASGFLIGIVSTAELVSAACGRVRPQLIGGMATPFGVYLTGGGVRGGVGDLALACTGIYLAVLNLVAVWLADFLVAPGGSAYAVPILGDALRRAAAPGALLPVAELLLFAVLFRASWITGYHAAEHQVVNTLEAGDDLRSDVVREKPRVHPRCGTNLVVAVLMMTFFWYNRASLELLGQAQPILAMLVTFLFWRRIGGWVQQNVTTRPASRAQVESGIRAAEQLLSAYQKAPDVPAGRFRRVWNMGLLQVMSGAMLVPLALWLLGLVVPLPEILRVW